MAKYQYPVVLAKNELGGYCVVLPDFKSNNIPGMTQGKDIEDALFMASDYIGCFTEGMKEEEYPIPSKVDDIVPREFMDYYPNSFVSIVIFDTEEYKKRVDNPIKYAREQAGLSIQEAADVIGCPYSTMNNWNNKRHYPPDWCMSMIVDKLMKTKKIIS